MTKRRLSKKELANLRNNEEKRIQNAKNSRKAKKEQEIKYAAEQWREFIDIKKRITQLDDLAFRYLTGETKLTKDQVTTMNNLIKIYSEKIIPPAKPTTVTKDNKKIVIGLPDDLKNAN